MAFFTGRSELGKSPETRLTTQGSAQQQVRRLVRDDFATRQRPADNDLAGYAVPPLQQTIAISLREIDGLIVMLRRRREELLGETARMQSEIIEYARLNQSTIASTKIITERLASFDKASDADSIQEAPTIPIMIAAGARAYEDTLELCLVKVNLSLMTCILIRSTRNVSGILSS